MHPIIQILNIIIMEIIVTDTDMATMFDELVGTLPVVTLPVVTQ